MKEPMSCLIHCSTLPEMILISLGFSEGKDTKATSIPQRGSTDENPDTVGIFLKMSHNKNFNYPSNYFGPLPLPLFFTLPLLLLPSS